MGDGEQARCCGKVSMLGLWEELVGGVVKLMVAFLLLEFYHIIKSSKQTNVEKVPHCIQFYINT